MRAAIYIRVSTEDQAREGYSLEVQSEYLLNFAKREKWQIYSPEGSAEIYEDDGYSGYSLDRPAFQSLMSDARKKRFDLILVYKLDRFSRRLRDILNILDELETLGIEFKSATEPYETTTSSGKLMIQQLGSFAEFERNRIIERVVPGMIKGAENGQWQGARYAPFGYRYKKELKKLEVCLEEAKLVREIYKMYLAGDSACRIAGNLYNQGVASRSGGKFHSKLICDILKNKVYLGKLVWNRNHYDMRRKTKNGEGKGYRYIKNSPSKVIEVDGVHEAIIDSETFDMVQKKRESNATYKGGYTRYKNRVYYISGLLYCAECGMKYHGVMLDSNHRTKEKKPWYRCISKSYPSVICKNPQVSAENLEKQLVDKFLYPMALGFPVQDAAEDIYGEILLKQSVKEPIEHYTDQHQLKRKCLDQNLKQQSELYELYKGNHINIEVYRQKATELRQEEGILQKDMQSLKVKIIDRERGVEQRIRTQYFLKSLKERDYQFTEHEKKEFMRIIFRKIVIQNKEIVSEQVDMSEPWNFFYNRGLECQKKQLSQKRKSDRCVSVLKPLAAR